MTMSSANTSPVLRFLRDLRDDSPGEGSDARLLARFVGGCDEPAFDALVRRHGPMVYSVCRRVLGHAQDAEDAFQATFLVLARQASSIRKPASLASWLYGVAFRVARKARSAGSRRQLQESLAANYAATATMPEGSLLPEAAWRELWEILDEELNRLPEKYRRLSSRATWRAGPMRRLRRIWAAPREPSRAGSRAAGICCVGA
jgi:RNA polymerase sigma factor (sigma-70 family)